MNGARTNSPPPRAIPLCRTAHGVAVACTCCGRVQFSLGNARLTLNAVEIAVLLAELTHFRARRPSSGPALHDPREGERPTRRNHVVAAGGDGAAFLFDRQEMSELRQLLAGARLALHRRRTAGPPKPGSDRAVDMLH